MTYLLISVADGKTFKTGEIIHARDNPTYGRRERLPQNIRLEVTGATMADVTAFKDRWLSSINYSVLTQNPARWRVKMEIDPALVTATGINNEVKQAIKAWILGPHEGNWIATLFNQSSTHLTVEIAKGQSFGLLEIKQDVNLYFTDKLEETSGFQQYRFSDADVGFAVTAGTALEAANEDARGNIPATLLHHTMTKAQALTRIENRLAP